MQHADLIDRLVAAQREAVSTVDPKPFSQLDREAAYGIQTTVVAALGAHAGMLKTAVLPDGAGAVAPIFVDKVGYAPSFRLSSRTVAGLEVEVGVVLATDVPAGADAAAVSAAVGHYFLGVEICASRFTDRLAPGPVGGLADSMAAYGYAIGPRRSSGAEIDGLMVKLSFGGKQIYAGPAEHGFGSVMASVVAYAAHQHPAYPLRAGTIITTGSMCGLAPTSGPGHVIAGLGDETLEFDLV